jgi:hypothetical protein
MDESYGRFAWIYDSDGNKIELWQPLPVKTLSALPQITVTPILQKAQRLGQPPCAAAVRRFTDENILISTAVSADTVPR